MNVKLQLLTVGVLFFSGQTVIAQKTKGDTATVKNIDEVVVLGYSKITTKPKDVSANTTISSEMLENRPNVSFLNSIQGSAPGVTIASGSGSPGSAKIDVVIRGVSSLNASTDPLIVIDGVPTNANQFRNLNADDIDAVSILRDAAATSIYGNRGANGVIIVKTKGGKFNAPLAFSYSSTTGVSVLPQNRYHLANAKEFLTIQKNLGVTEAAAMTDEEIANYPINTDWNKEFFKPDLVQQHNLSATFGGENVSVYTSLGYLNQGGMIPNTNFQRMTFRNNITGKSKNNRFTFTTQLGLAYSKRNQLNQETQDINNFILQNPLLGALMGNPATPASIANTGQELFNILTENQTITPNYNRGDFVYVLQDILKNKSVFHQIQDTNVFTGATVSYKLTDKWSVTNRSGLDYKVTNGDAGRDPNGFLSLIVAYTSKLANGDMPFGGNEQLYNSRELNFNSVTSTNYSMEFGDNHTLDLGGYLEYTKVHYLYNSQNHAGLDPRVWSMGTGQGYVPTTIDGTGTGATIRYLNTVSAQKINAGSLAYFATLEYDYAGKYGVSGVIRRDGTYRFASDYRWGTFWSVGARWNIDQEGFMSGSPFQMLKLRGSYGTQGNQNVVAPAYGFNAMITSANLIRDVLSTNNTENPVYNNGSSGFYLSQLGNSVLQWEEIAQANIGLDFRTLKGRLEGNIDFYNKQTTKLFTDVQVSAINGLYEYNGNLGGIRNRGVELLLRYKVFDKNFKLSVFANGSYNKNTITDLQIPLLTGSLINEVGGTVYQWNVVPYMGINPENGKMMYMDINGNITDNNPTEADRRATGKNYFPAYIGGFGFNAEYNGFFLDTLFSFQADYYRTDNQEYWAYLGQGYAMDGFNVSSHLLNAWTPDNPNTDVPSWDVLKGSDNSSISDRFLRDASFIRFKSLTLGYSLPKRFSDKVFVKNLKIFLQGENLYLWRKEYNGFDPEGLGTFPLGSYPNPRTISLGTSFEF